MCVLSMTEMNGLQLKNTKGGGEGDRENRDWNRQQQFVGELFPCLGSTVRGVTAHVSALLRGNDGYGDATTLDLGNGRITGFDGGVRGKRVAHADDTAIRQCLSPGCTGCFAFAFRHE
jgi:hypothetical protein